MIAALDHFLLEPIRHRHMGLWAFRMSQLLHERTNGSFDELYIKCSRALKPPKSLGDPRFIGSPAVKAAVGELERDGCSILPRRLPDSDIDEITKFAFSTPAYAFDPHEEIQLAPGALPRNTARHYWPVSKLLKVPAIQNLMLDPAFSLIAQNYLAATPVLTSVTLWIDGPADTLLDAHQYHYDNDGPGFLKFFFYLTDVDRDTGAHCYLKGTQARRKPQPFKLSRIYQDDELYDYYGREREVMFVAPRGTIIAEDTAGFHRGSTIERQHRLLMQFQYSVLDIPLAEELEGLLTPAAVDRLPAALQPVLAKLLVQRN